MAAHPDYPFVFQWRDRHGKNRWRFRRGKKIVYLPGAPGDVGFDDAYERLIAGLPLERLAEVVRHPGAATPRSLRAAWRTYTTKFPEWKANSPSTKAQQTAVAEAFLTEPVVEKGSDLWGDMPISDLKRMHVRTILAAMSDRPHAGRHQIGRAHV